MLLLSALPGMSQESLSAAPLKADNVIGMQTRPTESEATAVNRNELIENWQREEQQPTAVTVQLVDMAHNFNHRPACGELRLQFDLLVHSDSPQRKGKTTR